MSFGGLALTRIRGKPGVTKGGQNTILLDSKRRYIHAWHPRHSLNKREKPFTQEGPAEIKAIMDMIDPLIEGHFQEETDNRGKLFREPPHITFDNHFSGNPVMHYMGIKGYRATCTCRRDRLPDKCRKESFHFKKVAVSWESKVARYEEPIVAAKYVMSAIPGEKPYVCTHVSFQSTGGANISTVNALRQVGLYVRPKSRGRGNQKRRYGIEMNEGRALYLGSYSAVDSIDHLVENWNCSYVCWKWYHSPMRHGKAMSATMAYLMYEEYTEGDLNPDWKVEKPMTKKQFRKVLSRQMCEYRTFKLDYPGNENLRQTTNRMKHRRGRKRKAREMEEVVAGRVSYEQYVAVKNPESLLVPSRFCNENFDTFKVHAHSFTIHKGGSICAVCGEQGAYWTCSVCGKYMHWNPKGEKKQTMLSCAADFHNESFFGLARCDAVLVGKEKKDWRYPTCEEKRSNHEHICNLRKRYLKEAWDAEEDAAETD